MLRISTSSSSRRRYTGTSHAVLLGALLATTGFVVTPAHADDPVVLGPLTVEDQADKNTQHHDTGLNVLPSTVQDTPQSINVISQEQLKAQAVTSLEGALKNVPGITIAIGEGGTLAGDQFKIRGFDAKDDVYLDGLRDFGAYTRDSFNYEEVQVLKGPSGAMFGRGTTGGAVNVISKRPTLSNAMDFDAFIGNGEYYRGLADVNYVIGDTSAVRITGMLAHTGVVDRDVVKSDRWGVAPSVSFGLGTNLNFTLSYFHQQDDRIPDYGLVVAQRPGQLIAGPVSEYGVPRSTFTGYNTDRDNQKTDMFTARLNYQANDWLTLSNDTRYALYSRYFQYTTVDRCDFLDGIATNSTNNCSGVIFGPTPQNALGGIGGGGPYNQNAWGVQDIATARADFSVGGFKNQLIAGLDWSVQDNDKLFYAYHLPSLASGIYTIGTQTQARGNIGISLFNPTHTPPAGYTPFIPTLATIAGSTATGSTVLHTNGVGTDYAFFATERFWFDDAWSVIGGFRYDDYMASLDSTTVALAATNLKSHNSLFSPRASLVFEPTEDQTYYVSWGKSAIPQGTSIVGAGTAISNVTTQLLQPEKAETFEVGAKVGLLDGALGFSGSLFTVRKNNALHFDPSGSGLIDAQSGDRERVNGFEASVTGKLADDWDINVAYTYLDSTITYDQSCTTSAPLKCVLNTFTIGMPVIFVPKNAATLWTTFDLHELAPGLSAGGGITYQDAMNVRYTVDVTGAPTKLTRIARIPETFTVDAYAAYQMDTVRFALNVQNLFDDLYYTQSFGNRGTPGPGRTFIFSVSWAPEQP
ncbi:MAG TPA: TonB-dependent receptor [Rhizomicrobium sp.]|nr:TonB-dependent receptor [Rhizomicrobium sp.]